MTIEMLSATDAIARSIEQSACMVAVDIGNTNYKFGLFNTQRLDAARNAGIYPAFPFSIDDLRIAPRQLRVLPIWLSILMSEESVRQQPVLWLTASVNRQHTEDLFLFLKQKRPNDIFGLLVSADVPIQTAYQNPQQLGIDRKLAALAASRLFKEKTPILVIDIGTAVKFDLVDENGIFLGGSIAPGPEISLQSLSQKTEKLPTLSWSVKELPESYPAANTVDAIRSGIFGNLAGAAFYFYKESLTVTKRSSIPILLTGGGAISLELPLKDFFTPFYPESEIRIRTVRDLILSGIELTRETLMTQISR